MLPCLDPLRQRRPVSALTNPGVAARRRLAARNIVRFVARHAGQRALAFTKTRRHPHPVSLARKLQTLVLTPTRRLIEVQDEVFERLAGTIGKRASMVVPQISRQ